MRRQDADGGMKKLYATIRADGEMMPILDFRWIIIDSQRELQWRFIYQYGANGTVEVASEWQTVPTEDGAKMRAGE